MPPIPDRYLDSVVFLFPDEDSARQADGSAGSGFLASWPDGSHDPALRSLYIVTNRHVAENAEAVRVCKAWNQGIDILATSPDEWRHHPDGDDVSVFPLDLGLEQQWYYAGIPFSQFMHQGNLEGGWLGPGEDVFLLGRHFDRNSRQLDAPMARFGHLAARPVKVRNEQRCLDQLSYLVEVLSRSGYSGSPVVAFRLQLDIPHVGAPGLSLGQPTTRASFQAGTPGDPMLLGICWGHLNEPTSVLEPGGAQIAEKWQVLQNTGLAAVVPAWKITEILEDDELARLREESRARRRRELETLRANKRPATNNEEGGA